MAVATKPSLCAGQQWPMPPGAAHTLAGLVEHAQELRANHTTCTTAQAETPQSLEH